MTCCNTNMETGNVAIYQTENSKGKVCKDPRCAFPCESEVIFVMFCAFPVLF